MKKLTYWLFLTLLYLCLVRCSQKSELIGYTDQASYDVGDTIKLYLTVQQDEENFEITINDLNGRVLQTFYSAIKAQQIQEDVPYEKGFGFKPTFEFVLTDLESGIYLVNNKIPFVVKTNKPTDIIVLYESNTINAYNREGGKSMYYSDISGDDVPAYISSFLRPSDLPSYAVEFFKFLPKANLPYKVGYLCDKDMDDYENIKDTKLMIIPGHSEYWTKKARINFDRYVDSGKNALILSGNSMWWQVRYSKDGNQMICYKGAERDTISDRKLVTTNWSLPILDYPIYQSIGVDFEYGGYGKKEGGYEGFKLVDTDPLFFSGTALKKNDILKIKTSEYDGAFLSFSEDSSEVKLENPYNFFNYKLIGYDIASRKKGSNGAWIAMQKKPQSGVIINTSTTDWCGKRGMNGEHGEFTKRITTNMINVLLDSAKTTKIFY